MTPMQPSNSPPASLPSAAPRARPTSRSVDEPRAARVDAHPRTPASTRRHDPQGDDGASTRARHEGAPNHAASDVPVAEPARVVADVPTWVLLHIEATARGFRNALAFKRWCIRREVVIKRDGKRLWVAPSDVDRAVERLPSRAVEPSVMSAVAAIQSRRR